jgi:tetratricopeptide (TPR) repeat protein
VVTGSISGWKRRAALLSAFFVFALSSPAWQSDDLAAKSEQAKSLMASHRFEDAIPIYRELVKSVPGNPGLLFNLGLAEHMAGREQESIPHFEAVLKVQPNFLPALISLGAARLALSDPEQAVPPLRKAVVRDSANRDARGMLADALTAAGRFDQAAEQYRKLTELSRDDPRAWYGLGNSYQSMARDAFDRMQKIDAKSPWVLALVADTRVQRRQYRSAFFFYREALNQLPEVHGIHAAMAEVYRKSGHPEWAATEDRKEQKLPPPDCKLHPAECQFLGGHDLEAVAGTAPSLESLYWRSRAANELALQAFFRLGEMPPSVEIHELKAQIARDQNQHLESVREWRAALALAPGDPHLRAELAASLFLAADYRAAVAETEKLLGAGMKSPELYFTAGDSFVRLEEPEKAVPYLQKALALHPKMLPAHASLGLALSRIGKNAEAIPHLEKALDLDDDGSLHYQLARALQSSGQAERARTVMAQYQDIVKRNDEQKAEVAREAQIAPPE